MSKSFAAYLIQVACFANAQILADVITFRDPVAFRNATSGNIVTDFEGLVPGDTVEFVSDQSLTQSGATFRPLNGTLFLAGAMFYQDTSVLTVQNGANPVGNFLSILLPEPVRAVSVDVSTPFVDVTADFHFQLSNGDSTTTAAGRSPTFFGLVSTTAFDSLTIRSAHPNTTSMEIDNFEFASVVTVPETSSAPLWAMAIGGMWLRKVRRRPKD